MSAGIEREARNFILKNGIDHLGLTLEDMDCLCESVGFDLIELSRAPEQVLEHVRFNKESPPDGCCYSDDEFKIIIRNNHRPMRDQLFAIAHEIGHLVLDNPSEVVCEQISEADEFAVYLLAHPAILKKCRADSSSKIRHLAPIPRKRMSLVWTINKAYEYGVDDNELVARFHKYINKVTRRFRKTVTAVLIAVALVAAVSLHRLIPQAQSQAVPDAITVPSESPHDLPPEIAEEVTPEITPEVPPKEMLKVYIAETGSKYHLESCYHIKDSVVVEMTRAEAESESYGPCKDCRPDLEENPTK